MSPNFTPVASAQKVKEDQISELYNVIQNKVKGYDPTLDGVVAKEFEETEQVSFRELVFRFSSCGDKCTFITAVMASVCFGASMPGFCLLFGEMIDSVG
mgnify:CR=1 FL=1